MTCYALRLPHVFRDGSRKISHPGRRFGINCRHISMLARIHKHFKREVELSFLKVTFVQLTCTDLLGNRRRFHRELAQLITESIRAWHVCLFKHSVQMFAQIRHVYLMDWEQFFSVLGLHLIRNLDSCKMHELDEILNIESRGFPLFLNKCYLKWDSICESQGFQSDAFLSELTWHCL